MDAAQEKSLENVRSASMSRVMGLGLPTNSNPRAKTVTMTYSMLDWPFSFMALP